MRTQTLQSPMAVVEFNGEVKVQAADGQLRMVKPGEVLPAGTVLQIADGAELRLEPPAAASSDATAAEQNIPATPAIPGEGGTTAEIAAIQKALLQGVDPTQLEATAAGGAPAAGGGGAGGSGNGGFITVSRTGDATLASAGFDTTYQSTTLAAAPVATGAVVDTTIVPAPVVTPDTNTLNESHLDANNPLDPDTVSGSQAGEAATLITGNLNIDFAGSTGSVVFQDVANQPALSSGGSPLVWSISSDGLTLTGSVGAVAILTVSINPDGTYTVDLDGPLDGDGLQPAFGIVATNAEGSATTGAIVITVADDVPTAADDSNGVREDGSELTVSGNVLSNDTQGADGASVTPQTVETALGTLELKANGDYSFTLNNSNPTVQALGEGETLPQSFSYVLTDGDGDTSTATLTITITGSNDGVVIGDLTPASSGGEGVVNEDDLPAGSDSSKESLSVNGSFTVSAPDGLASITVGSSVLTLASLQGASASNPLLVTTGLGNQLAITGFSDGVVSYTYTLLGQANHSSEPLFDNTTVVATDRDGDTSSSSLSIQIVDDVPTAADDSNGVREDGSELTVSGNVLSNDTQGADGASVTPQTVETALGTLELKANGDYSFTLNNSNPTVQALGEGETLPQAFSYVLTDGDGDTSTATLTITITGSNDGVVIGDLTPASSGGEGVVNEDDLPAGSDSSKESLSVNGSFTVSAPDGLASITVGSSVLTLASLQGASASNPLLVTTGLGNQLAITGFSDGVVSYTYTLLGQANHSSEPLFDNTTVVATDRDGDTSSSSLSIQIVDDVPTAADDSNGVREDGSELTVSGNVLSNDTQGADGASVTPQTVETALGTLELKANGDYSFTLNNSNPTVQALGEGETLPQSFSYVLTDGDGDTSTATLTITITGSNDGVVIGDLTPASSGGEGVVNEDDLPAGSDSSKESLSVNGSFTVSAPDGLASITVGSSVLTLASLQGASASNPLLVTTGLGNQLAITGFSDGVVSYTYTLLGQANHSSEPLFDNTTVVATDRDGDTSSSSLSIQIVDDVPTAADDSNGVREDGSELTVSGNVLSNDTQGADGASVTPQTVETALGTLELKANGDYSFTLNNSNPTVQALGEGETLPQAFSYVLTDGDGDTSTATLTITITGSNDGVVIGDLTPASSGGEGVVNEDDLPAGSDSSKESLSVDGSFTVSAPDGLASITVGSSVLTLASLQGASASNPLLVTTGLGNQLAITGFSDGVVSYTYTLLGQANHSSEPLFDNTTVVATDRDGDTSSSSLSIQIVDDVPTAADDSNGVREDGSELTVSGNVLSNDTQGADGASVTPQTVETALGTLELKANGDYSFTLNNSNPTVQALGEGETLPQSFSYVLTDGDGDTSTATLTITITGSNDGVVIGDLTPASSGGEGVVNEDDLPAGSDSSKESLSVDGSFTVSAPDGLASITVGSSVLTLASLQGASASNPLLVTTGLGNQLAITGFSDGVVSYTYTLLGQANHSSEPLFDNTTVVATDRDGDTSSSSLSIQIVDDVPTAADDSNGVREDGSELTVSGNVLSNDTQGADGASVTPQTVETALGTLELKANGDYSFTLNNSNPTVQALGEGETLPQSFSYVLTDGDGDTSTATLTITITGSNDGVVIGDLTPASSGGEGVVNEDDLPAGSDSSKESLSVNGSFTVSAPDGLASITVGSSVLTLASLQGASASNPLLVTTGLGNQLAITGFSDGVVSYTYTLLGQANHSSEPLFDNTTVVATDRDGDTSSSSLSIQIVDDEPNVSISDTPSSVVEGGTLSSGSWSLTPGADGATVKVWVGDSSYDIGTPIDTGKGILTVNADHSWTFAAVNNLDQDTTQSVSFTLKATDGDKDVASDSQTITITDGNGPTLGEVTSVNLAVAEAALGSGSNAISPAETASGSVQFTAGSDAIDSIKFGSTSGITVTGLDNASTLVWTPGGDGRTLVGRSDGVDVIRLTLSGASTLAAGNSGSVTVTAELLGHLQHEDSPNASSLGVSGITVVGADDDGDSVSAQVTVSVSDDVPSVSISDTPSTVVEGGTLSSGSWSLTPGADGATVKVWVGDSSYDIGTPINTGKGILTVNADHSWTFAAANDLVQNAETTQSVSFTLKATDGDKDVASDSQTITITDGNGPTLGEVTSVNLAVAEAALGSGSNAISPAETASGSVQFTAGSDAIDSIKFGSTSGITVTGLDNASTLVWTPGGDGRTLVGRSDGVDVIRLTLSGASTLAAGNSGSVTVTAELLGHLQHEDSPNASSLGVSGITVVGADDDGDSVSAQVTVSVSDDAPTLTSVESAIIENSADALNAVGSSLLQMGADQNGHADLTGNIAGWNGGSVTCGLSALTSGEQPVYYSVSPSSPGVLFAYTSSSAVPYGTSGASQSLIFTLTYGADGHYTLDMNGTLDAPKHSYSDTFNENIGGNFDYLLLGSDGTLYKPTDTIPTTAKIVMTIDASGTSTVNSSTQGLGVSNGWITSSESLIMKFTNPVVSAQFSIDTQSGDATNIVTWTVHGMAANGTLTTQTGTTSFSDGVMTSIPTTLTHITQIDLSDQSGSGYRVNGTELVYRVEEEPINTNLAVAIVDADGDKATSSLAVTFTPAVEDLLVVGTNANDISGSTAPYVTPVDFGAIDGGKGNDILIGDEGRATLVGKSVNVILMLDVSGSMTDTIQFNGGWTTRLEALKSAVENLLDDLKDSKATNVRVELISFSDSATNLGVFDLKTPSELAAALSQVANLHDDNMTNYEAALQMALAWAKSSGPDAPLSGSNVVNQAIFISDGLPNTWITQSGHISSGTTGNAISQFLGGDGTNEVTELERVFGSIQAVGINVDAAALDVLNQVEGEAASVTPDAATNITTAEQLNQVLADLNPELHFSPAGRDTITGGDGKDLIFGDAPFTDNLATAAGLSIAAGGGWQVFAELEAGRGLGSYAGWDRADTLQYINAHLVELSQESGRTGGNDILDGGAGDDILFGQEGDDTMTGGSGADLLSGGSGVDRIDGGTGNDTLRGGLGADILTGGDGADTFVFMAADKDGTRDTITDFTLNQDKLDLRDVLNDPTGNLGDYLKITQSGDDALVNVYSAGNASAGGTPSVTIVLDGLGSNATELSQLQDYLINHDGVIK